MATFILLLFFSLLATVTTTEPAATKQNVLQNIECTTTKLKPSSCLHFVITNDLDRDGAAAYCFKEFNGALVFMNYSSNEIMDFSKRYFWWAKSPKTVVRIRLGMMLRRTKTKKSYPPDNNVLDFDPIVSPSNFNPRAYGNKILDKDIWERSFPENYSHLELSNLIAMDRSTRNTLYPYVDERGSLPYLSITPQTAQWVFVIETTKIPFMCEVPRFPKIYCEKDWELNLKSRSCVRLFNVKLNYTAAIQHCQKFKSSLAAFDDLEEYNLIRRYKFLPTPMQAQEDGYPTFWTATRLDTKKYNEEYRNYFRNVTEYEQWLLEKKVAFNIDSSQPTSFFMYDPVSKRLNSISTDINDRCFVIEKFVNFINRDCNTVTALPFCRKMASTQRL